jgi:hypothetical protein
LQQSPFLEQIRKQPAAAQVQQHQDIVQLKNVVDWGLSLLGTSGEQLLQDVFGQAIVFAYMPSQAEPIRGEAGLVLIAPRKPEVLRAIIQKINEFQRAAGDLNEVREVQQGANRWFLRIKKDGSSEAYAITDGLFLFSGEAWAIEAALERSRKPAPTTAAIGFQKLGFHNSFLSIWLAPRTFDAAFAASAKSPDPTTHSVQLAVAKLWKAVDQVGIALRMEGDVSLECVLMTNKAQLPQPLQRLLTPWPDAVPLAMELVGPDVALACLRAYWHIPTMLQSLATLQTTDEADEVQQFLNTTLGAVIGRDQFPAILNGIGPFWGAWILPPEEPQTLWPAAVVAVQIPDADIGRRMLQAVDFAAQLARVRYNQTHSDQIEWQEVAGVRKFHNPKGFAAGLIPCYQLRDSHLILATHPNAMARLQSLPTTHDRKMSLRFHGESWRDYLVIRSGKWVEWLTAGTSGDSRKAFQRDLDRLTAFVREVETFEILSQVQADRWVLQLRVKTRLPIHK